MTHTSPPPVHPRLSPAHHPTPIPVHPTIKPAIEPAAKVVHDYSSTQFNLPAAISEAIKTFAATIPSSQVDPEQGREKNPHITLKYGNPSAATEPISNALKDSGPITIDFGKLSIFKGTAGQPDVLKVDVTSPGLLAMNKLVGDAVEHTGSTFPGYKPHATVAYLNPGEGLQYVGKDIPGVTGESVIMDSVTFSGKDGVMTQIPLKAESEAPEEKDDSSVVDHLRLQLANAWVLYANLKHYHWQTFGPLFRDLHLMFEEFATSVFDTIDDLAERMRMLDQDVDLIELKQFQSAANVAPAEAKQTMRDMLEQSHANAELVISDMRDAVEAAEEEHDPGSVDLFSRFVQVHEKQEWFLRQALKAGDSLVG